MAPQRGPKFGDQMHYASLAQFLNANAAKLVKGPTALVFAEDAIELDSTLEHALNLGFAQVVCLAAPHLPIGAEIAPQVHRIDFDVYADRALPNAVNLVIAAAPGAWLHYCYNAEYLFFPFCETRKIRDFTTFLTEERRASALSYVIDLYAKDLTRHPDAVSRGSAMLDRLGYYALGRTDPAKGNLPKDRQLDFFGGLRWRFEEHVPWSRRRIDRISVFQAVAGLALREDHTFSIEEYNTYACPWHNNPTTAVCSFRTAKALRLNPGSRDAIPTFTWRNSEPFEWSSEQLMNLGLMEPGQWF